MSKGSINRRDFVKAGTAAAATAILAGSMSAATVTPLARKRYAMIGTGHRGTGMWGKDIFERYANEIEFVGLCDKNGKRAEAGRKLIGAACPTFTDFDEMVAKTRPELLMVTTVDSTHHEFITRALAKGIDVITEKPMVTEAVQAQAILDAEKKYNRKITVAFNYRYAPKHQKIKEILRMAPIIFAAGIV
jgi:predicted dehydrogenase